ncbi:MAG: hypothetical protein J6127_01535 [Clostridiales bacterium]|nr:hypothetical protein [Clostridiales bacterium]
MRQEKKEKILIVVTILVVALLLVATYYDRSSALLKRTLAYRLPDYARVDSIDKHGFMFYRVGYEAKISINAAKPEDILTCFVQGYDFSGNMLSLDEYEEISNDMFENEYSYVKIRPQPAPGSSVWMMEVITEEGHRIVHFMDIEAGDHAYLYIYYVR